MSILELLAKENPFKSYESSNKAQEESEARTIANAYNTTLAEKAKYDLSKSRERDQSADEIAKEADATRKKQLREMFAARYPEEAKKHADAINAMTTEEVAVEKAKNERADKLLRSVEDAPPSIREQAYVKAKEQAKQTGFDVSSFPETFAEMKSSGYDVYIKANSATRMQLMELKLNQQKANASTTTAAAAMKNANTQEQYRLDQVKLQEEANRVKLVEAIGKGPEGDTEIYDILKKKPTVTSAAPTAAKLRVSNNVFNDLAKEHGLKSSAWWGNSTDDKKAISDLARITEQSSKVSNGNQGFVTKAETALVLSHLDADNKVKFSLKPNYEHPKYIGAFGKAIVKTKDGYEIVYEKYDNLPEAARHEELKTALPNESLFLGDLGRVKLNLNNPAHKSMLEAAQTKGLPLIGAKELRERHESVQQMLKQAKTGKGRMSSKEREELYKRIKDGGM